MNELAQRHGSIVRLLAPGGIASIVSMRGKAYTVGADGVVEVEPDDVVSFPPPLYERLDGTTPAIQEKAASLDGLRKRLLDAFRAIMSGGAYNVRGRLGRPSAQPADFDAWGYVIEMGTDCSSSLTLKLPDGRVECWYDVSVQRSATPLPASAPRGSAGRPEVYDWAALAKPLAEYVEAHGQFGSQADLEKWCLSHVKLRQGARKPKGQTKDLKNARDAIKRHGLDKIGLGAIGVID